MKNVSPRQLFLFLACMAPAEKLLLLPAQLADRAKNDLLFPALAQILLQTLAVFCVLLLVRRGQSFYGMLKDAFGKIAAAVLTTVFALFLFFAAVLPLLEQKLFVQAVFYDTLPSIVAFAPFFVFAAYLCSKPLGSHGRLWDILAPIAVVGFAGILALSVPSADYAALLPAGAAGARGFGEGLLSSFGWFYDAALLIPFLGKLEYKKGIAWKGALCYLAGGAGVLFFLATFYGIFAEISVNQLFAFSATSKYFSGVTMLGRIDYLFIFLLALVTAFYCALPVQGGIDCLLQAYGKPRYLPTILSVAACAVYLLIDLLFEYKFGDVLHVMTGVVYWLFPVFCIAVPVLLAILGRRRREIS